MTAGRTPLIAGNWKMNGTSRDGLDRARALVDLAGGGTDGFELLICPPVTLLGLIGDILAGSAIALGAQDCHMEESGAHTGDISAAMLKDIGCAYVIVGHSERRANHGETDAIVRAKADAALRAGLIAIVCVGETEAERDAGRAGDVVSAQLAGSIPDDADAGNLVVAYEPVWAIGTGRTPTTADVADMHGTIRRDIAERFGADTAAAMRVLYGGSVKPDNAAELIGLDDVDGGLVGGASLVAEDFWAIALASRA
jgi:triosephosphate isomerase